MAELKTPLKPSAHQTDWLSQPLALALRLDWEKAIYITFIVLAVVTRFAGLGDRVVSHDESLHTQYSFQFYNGDGYAHTPLMHGPFLFHITAFSYWLFGHTDFTARIPVAFLGVILVAMPYFLRDWIGRKGALFASFILLISPYVSYYSRYIRHDVFVIVWALIVFIATWYYLRDGEEKSLWWFSAGLALMFATKEVAFIYVAVFGSFLVLRLIGRMSTRPWFGREIRRLVLPLLVVVLGGILLGVGYLGKGAIEAQSSTIATETAEGPESFAADPSADLSQTDTGTEPAGVTTMRWLQIVGLVIVGAGIFYAAYRLRSRLDKFPEFDLIVLYTTLILPSVTSLLVVMAGWNPLNYNIPFCEISDPNANPLAIFIARISSAQCWSGLVSSGPFTTALFLIPLLVVSVAIGVWWRQRTWLVCAAIFHIIFVLLYTSVFTNPWGWFSGTIGSLGYWLEQQEVQRGSQPWFYYGFVLPFYEFLPLIFTFAAIRLWTIKHKLHKITAYWFWLLLGSAVLYGLTNWFYNINFLVDTFETTRIPGVVVAAILLAAGTAYWFVARRAQVQEVYGIVKWSRLMSSDELFGFVPAVIWWFLLSILAYSYAGEKMPWLSIHFVIPMAFLVGWYFNERLKGVSAADFFDRRALLLTGVTAVFIVAVFLTIMPIFRGDVDFNSQTAGSLNSRGQLIGSFLVAAGLLYVILYQLSDKVNRAGRQRAWLFSIFGLLALLTMRFSYMANFPNADYSTEYLVYAHGAPATKTEIMSQIEELSMRLYGDKSINVVYDNESSWPYTWYLREYPNRTFIGANPTPTITEAPVLLIGNANWDKVEPLLRGQYDAQTYTYLWWPMEEYRQIGWEAIFGNPHHLSAAQKARLSREDFETEAGYQAALNGPTRKGLGNPEVREAIWDIFFYRDYTRYGEAFSKNYTFGQWPLRDEVRLYIRKDVKALMWDRGVGATAVVVPQDPYLEGEIPAEPLQVIGTAGAADGQLASPRNLATSADGRLYVADSGNHRIHVFGAEGEFLFNFGEFGTRPGQFNEPWGIAADDEFVYVADTWNHRVQKFTLDGEFVTAFGQSGTPDNPSNGGGLFFGPRDVALLADNQLLVTDTGNHRLQLFTREGDFVQVMGQLGNQLGQFFEPVGLATDPEGDVWLVDTWNGRMQEFVLSNGALLPEYEWPVDAWESQSIENKPYAAVDSSGRVYITDPEGYQILIFEQDGSYVGRLGHYSTDATGFGLPNGIAIDAEDNVYVADAGNGRILKFAPLLEKRAAQEEMRLEEGERIEGEAGEAQIEDTPADEERAPGEGSSNDGPTETGTDR